MAFLKELEIINFRCFDKTHISGFGRINLITGKNNSGKTALLEALLINDAPNAQTLINIQEFRQVSELVSKSMPGRAWDDWFFQQNTQSNIIINSRSEQSSQSVEISLQSNINSSVFFEDIDESNGGKMQLVNKVLKRRSPGDQLQIKVINDHQEKPLISTLIATSAGLMIQGGNYDDQKLPIISTYAHSASADLKNAYDRAKLENKDSEVLQAIQIIDPTIISIDSIFDTLYLTRQGEKRLPLSLCGAAINRMMMIILQLIHHQRAIFIIDEIENGLHYDSQRNFWQILFRLAVKFNIQIFATTHSLEMIKAFLDVGLGKSQQAKDDQSGTDQGVGLGVHFEMARHWKTQQIVVIRRDLDMVEYALRSDSGRGVRGE